MSRESGRSAGGVSVPGILDCRETQDRRPAELDAYNVFEGQWSWEAEVVNAEGEDKNWTGEASWRWTLDNHWLHGMMSAKTKNTEFEAAVYPSTSWPRAANQTHYGHLRFTAEGVVWECPIQGFAAAQSGQNIVLRLMAARQVA